MVTGPDFIALQVTDLEGAGRFYESRLGLRRAPASPPGAIVFQTQPVAFAVREPLADVDLDGPGTPGLGVALWLHADNPQELHDSLESAGTPIETAPFDGPFGRTFTFRDPAGYSVTIHGDA